MTTETVKKGRILIISNACFSNTDSNGRTLAKLFQDYSYDELAQFYTYGTPDFTICKSYYRVTDRDALYSFLHKAEIDGTIDERKTTDSATGATQTRPVKKMCKTPLKMLLREFAWRFGSWKGNKLNQWLEQINPKCIFVSVADNTFLIDFANYVAKKFKIPVILYSTEDYYFKEYNYLTRRESIFYTLFHSILKHGYHRLEPYVKCALLNTEALCETYAKAFSFPCYAMYAKSDIDFINNFDLPKERHDIRISYLGNMGLNRHKALIEIADEIANTIPNAKLDVYGKIPDQAKEEMLANANICYKGFVSYEEVVKVMHESNLLVHAEYNDEFYNRDLKHAFSTKIADSVCCGTPFLLYASEMLTETQFLKKNRCAFVVTQKSELNTTLQQALTTVSARKQVVEQAGLVRKKIFCAPNDLRKVIDMECGHESFAD